MTSTTSSPLVGPCSAPRRPAGRWRDGVTPQSAGLPAGPRRRAEGLRREELAGLAGISTDYLTRLEQGRATAPSAQVVQALTRALRLSDPERDLLFRLAGHAAPGLDVVPSRVTPSVRRLLDRLSHTPLVVYDATWTLVLANAPYDALMGDTSTWHGLERNAVWRNLTGRNDRVVHQRLHHPTHRRRPQQQRNPQKPQAVRHPQPLPPSQHHHHLTKPFTDRSRVVVVQTTRPRLRSSGQDQQ